MLEKRDEEVFLEALARSLKALYMKRTSEAVKWIADLIYYASLRRLDEEYIRLFDKVLLEVERQPPPIPTRFAESLNRTFEDMKEGSEYTYISKILDRAEELKMGKMREYIVTPEEFKRKAKKILDEILKG